MRMKAVSVVAAIAFVCLQYFAYSVQGNCPEIEIADSQELLFCSNARQGGSECFLKCEDAPEDSVKSKLTCQCTNNICEWIGDHPLCDAYICLKPDHNIATFRLMDSWKDGFVGLIEFQNLPKNMSGAWSLLLSFDTPLGQNAKLFASSMKMITNSDDKQMFTLRNKKNSGREIFNKKYPRATILVTDFEGEAPTSGYIGLYESVVEDAMCFVPNEYNEFVPIPSPEVLDQITPAATLLPISTKMPIIPTATSKQLTSSKKPWTPTKKPWTPTKKPWTPTKKTWTTTKKRWTPTKKPSPTPIKRTTSRPTSATRHIQSGSSITKMDNRFCRSLSYADAMTVKKSWVEATKTYVNGHLALQHKALRDWLVVIVFPYNVVSIEVWNVVVKDAAPPNKIWKLAPLAHNRRMDPGLFDISFIAKFSTELDEDPQMDAYICDTSFTSSGAMGPPATTSRPRTTTRRTITTRSKTPGVRPVGGTTPDEPTQWRPLPANRCSPSARTGMPVRGAGQTQPRHKWNTDKVQNNYNKALHYSILFYEAQRAGMLPSNNRIPWRGDSMLKDGCQIGVDLTKGWFDAGDHVKFNFPMAWSVTTLAWGGLMFRDAYEDAKEYNRLLDSLKWPLEYMINCHTAKYELVGQVGNGHTDHEKWGRPEQLNIARPVYKITQTRPGSDLAGEFAAALAACSMLFKESDRALSDKALKHAKELFEFADKYRARYNDSIRAASEFYPSTSGFKDEILWAAAWLYKATGLPIYLTKASALYTQMKAKYFSSPTFSWDHKLIGAQVILAELTNEAQYRDQVAGFMKNMMKMRKTPKGMIFYLQWGSARYAANAAFIGTAAALLKPPLPQRKLYLDFAKKQINYLLGSTGKSFVVGYGINYPKKPHHRASSCKPFPANCDWNSAFHSRLANPFTLYGALVGGPNLQGRFQDSRGVVVESEPACDYNAGFQGAVAGLKHFSMN